MREELSSMTDKSLAFKVSIRNKLNEVLSAFKESQTAIVQELL